MFRRTSPFDEMFGAFRDLELPFQKLLANVRALPGEVGDTGRLLPAPRNFVDFYPAVECFTRDKNLVFRMELAGIDPADVEVTTLGDQLLVRGEKKDLKDVKEKDYYLRETIHGRFERMFTLPAGVPPTQVKAWYTNGVLEITLPAAVIEATHKVPVEIKETEKKAIKAA